MKLTIPAAKSHALLTICNPKTMCIGFRASREHMWHLSSIYVMHLVLRPLTAAALFHKAELKAHSFHPLFCPRLPPT